MKLYFDYRLIRARSCTGGWSTYSFYLNRLQHFPINTIAYGARNNAIQVLHLRQTFAITGLTVHSLPLKRCVQ